MAKNTKNLSAEEVQLQMGKSLASAEQFLAASRRAFETRVNGEKFDPSLAIPAVVLAAFSVELAFKSIMLVKTGGFSQGHDLTELFKKLPQELQQDLADRVIDDLKMQQKVDKTFEGLLADNERVFETWRYSFEVPAMISADLSFLWSLSTIVLSLRRDLRSAP